MEQKLRNLLALNMKIERARRSFTQDDLAEMSDISAKHITKIENARVTPSIYLVFKIAKALNVTVDKLLSENE